MRDNPLEGGEILGLLKNGSFPHASVENMENHSCGRDACCSRHQTKLSELPL